MERAAPTTIHGRYLVDARDSGGHALLVGFHGYAESAEDQMVRLQAIAGNGPWLSVAVQGLHRFYQRSTNRVVASWMTRQDRERAIADNIAWVENCLDAVAAEWPVNPHVVFAGFSQGAAMAYRAAAASVRPVLGVIAVGGDVPPELTEGELHRIPAALLIRGALDPLYTESQFRIDAERLGAGNGTEVRALTTSGGHEWSAETTHAAALFLESLRSFPGAADEP
jgi:predicted esterase